MRLKMILLFSILLVLSGCLQTSILDEMGLIQASGFDIGEDGEIHAFTSYPTFSDQGTESLFDIIVLEGKAHTSKGVRIELNNESKKHLRSGQLRIAIYFKKLAERGLESLVNSLYRDPWIGNRIYLAVADTDMKELFNYGDRVSESIGMYLAGLVEHNIETENIPPANLHSFLFSMYNDGRDAYLPLIKIREDHPSVPTIALFKQDKMVATLDPESLFTFNLLLGEVKSGTKEFSLGDEFIVIEKLNSKKNWRLEKEESGPPTFYLDITVDGEVTDFSGGKNLDTPEALKEVENKVEEILRVQAKDIVEMLKNKGTDPLGFGEKYRSKTRDWKSVDWQEVYQTITVETSFNLRIIKSGAIE